MAMPARKQIHAKAEPAPEQALWFARPLINATQLAHAIRKAERALCQQNKTARPATMPTPARKRIHAKVGSVVAATPWFVWLRINATRWAPATRKQASVPTLQKETARCAATEMRALKQTRAALAPAPEQTQLHVQPQTIVATWAYVIPPRAYVLRLPNPMAALATTRTRVPAATPATKGRAKVQIP